MTVLIKQRCNLSAHRDVMDFPDHDRMRAVTGYGIGLAKNVGLRRDQVGHLVVVAGPFAAQEAIRAVPSSLRQASYGLGATKWQTIWSHVLPNALPGILTGTILAMSRAIGETAPLVVVGASTFITVDPDGPFSKFTTLPIQIYQWTSRPQDEFRNIAAAAIIVLLILLLTLNASAVLLRNRFSKRLT